MRSPFESRISSLSGPARDAIPVVPNDTTDLAVMAISLYVETGGAISLVMVSGGERVLTVPDFSIIPVGVRRVRATGTTASGIHALVLG